MLSKIAKKIQEVAINEDELLSDIAKEGIFFMPELAFVYECGKAIMIDKYSIFGSNIPTWEREVNLGNGGPTDLLFKFDNGLKIAIEFKMRDTYHAYIKDIQKLSRIDDKNTVRVFCALVDVFTDQLQNDLKQKAVEDLTDLQVKVISKINFPTKQSRYTGNPVSCVAAIWSVGDVTSLEDAL